MPFRARTDEGEIVVPAMVDHGEPVRCLRCAGRMFVRHPDHTARHFYHPDSSVGAVCPSSSSGESSEHARCVELAVEALQDTFADTPEVECAAEVRIDVTDGLSHHEYRRGDAVATLPTQHPEYGRGIIIEVQHKHKDKHRQLVTHDYLAAEFSVLWLTTDDFTQTSLEGSITTRFEQDDDAAFPACNGLNHIWDCESYQYTETHNFEGIPGAYLDAHESYEICTSRPCSLRRQWDPDIDDYRYAPEDLPEVTVLFAALEDAFPQTSRQTRTEWSRDNFRMQYGDAIVEKMLANGGPVAPCRGPGGVHQWQFRKSLSKAAAHVGLHDCRHCRASLYVDYRGYADEHTTIIFEREPDPELQLTSLESNPRHCDHPAHDEKAAAEGCPNCGLLN